MTEIHLALPDWWQIPAALLALAGFITLIVKWFMCIGRKDKTLKDHTEILKDFSKQKIITEIMCKTAQKTCMDHQLEMNDNIMGALGDLKSDVKDTKAIDILWAEIKENKRQTQEELMKITRSVGRIEGIVQRFRFDDKEGLK